ncbi:MAG: UDP-N-acetyl glucosamine 2-epimerase [Candidatus Melainabacteria bacterium]
MKVMTVLGARPQFIKSAPVSAALGAAGIAEVLVHTGQHYDAQMSDVFFEELGLKQPDYRLDVGSGSLAYQVGETMQRLEPVMLAEAPDAVLVYGDTNATFAGAFVAAAQQIPLAHVEAGLRSFNPAMPEERNRILTDHLARWCFAPTPAAMANLNAEGITTGQLVGDVMLDALLQFLPRATERFGAWSADLSVSRGAYLLLTMHRAETTAQPEKAVAILRYLDSLGVPVVFPVHPRVSSLGRIDN